MSYTVMERRAIMRSLRNTSIDSYQDLRDIIVKWIDVLGIGSIVSRLSKFNSNKPNHDFEFYDSIIKHTSFLDVDSELSERLYFKLTSMKKIVYFIIYVLRLVIYVLDKLEYRKLKTDSDILDSYDVSGEDIYVSSAHEPLKLKYVHLCKPEIEYRIISDTQSIGCADWHPIINEENEEIRAENIKVGEYIKTINGIEKIKKIIKLPFKRYMYDLTVEEPHIYYANGILVHNCVTFDTLIDVTDVTTKIKYRLPIFEIHYMFKKELTNMDRIIRQVYRLKYRIKLKIELYNKIKK